MLIAVYPSNTSAFVVLGLSFVIGLLYVTPDIIRMYFAHLDEKKHRRDFDK